MRRYRWLDVGLLLSSAASLLSLLCSLHRLLSLL
jgi:hypothetical protein